MERITTKNGYTAQSEKDYAFQERLIRVAPELLEALEGLYRHCAMVHNKWGDGCNQKEANAAIEAGKAAIRKAKGE